MCIIVPFFFFLLIDLDMLCRSSWLYSFGRVAHGLIDNAAFSLYILERSTLVFFSQSSIFFSLYTIA